MERAVRGDHEAYTRLVDASIDRLYKVAYLILRDRDATQDCSMEAVLGRRDTAAVLSALVFASIHVPMNLSANGGDWVAAAANAVFYQATVGLIACLAYTRHRAAVPIGMAHGLIIA